MIVPYLKNICKIKFMFLIHSLLIWTYRTLNFVVVFIQAGAVKKSKQKISSFSSIILLFFMYLAEICQKKGSLFGRFEDIKILF